MAKKQDQIDTVNSAAKAAILLKKQIDALDKELDDHKKTLREIADGEPLDIVVPDCGKVKVAKPREEKETTELVLNLDKLNLAKELKTSLIRKGIIVEKKTVSKAALASVTITPNV